MIYVRRKPFRRKPKDILALALKNLWAGEELICTKTTYNAIADRVDKFSAIQTDRRLATISLGEIRKIRRVM